MMQDRLERTVVPRGHVAAAVLARDHLDHARSAS
jgi:hypothetical protein